MENSESLVMGLDLKFVPGLLATFGGYNSCGDREGARLKIVGGGNVVVLSVPRFRSGNFFGLFVFSLKIFLPTLSILPEICWCNVGGGTVLFPPLYVERPCSTKVSARLSIFIPQPVNRAAEIWF